MKRLIHILIIFYCFNINLNAQNYSEGISTEFNFSNGPLPAIQTQFDKVSKDEVKKAISNTFKNYKARVISVKETKDEYIVEEFLLESSQKKSKAKFKITESNGSATLYSHFTNEESVISEEKTPNEINEYKKLVKGIANQSVVLVYDKLIDEQENEIKSHRKKINQAKKETENQHKNISKYSLNIKNSNQKIEGLKQSLSSQLIINNKNDELIKEKESEIASKSLKQMNKNISELEKKNKSILKDINKHKAEIALYEGQIAIQNSSIKGHEVEKESLKKNTKLDKAGRKKIKKIDKQILESIGELETIKTSVLNEENSIKGLEAKIETNQTEISNIKKEINNHNEMALNEQLKLLEKESKSLKQEKKKIEKEIEKETNSINENTENIRLSENKIEELKGEQKNIEDQLKKAENKLKETQTQKLKFK